MQHPTLGVAWWNRIRKECRDGKTEKRNNDRGEMQSKGQWKEEKDMFHH